ncbi:hypothetical protein [Sphingomonas colocasiae]|uniref:Uncharacterized protein n=1 Tax=Sphingomonas colocasiae TaxID=1848973 RepID=A0ABS7PVY3_9SPHN|nr:hypothetical protein [Sphingomonas colocasiae]MBY8825521.1 hypothetical protein [Sphingomonas colocasiae]
MRRLILQLLAMSLAAMPLGVAGAQNQSNEARSVAQDVAPARIPDAEQNDARLLAPDGLDSRQGQLVEMPERLSGPRDDFTPIAAGGGWLYWLTLIGAPFIAAILTSIAIFVAMRAPQRALEQAVVDLDRRIGDLNVRIDVLADRFRAAETWREQSPQLSTGRAGREDSGASRRGSWLHESVDDSHRGAVEPRPGLDDWTKRSAAASKLPLAAVPDRLPELREALSRLARDPGMRVSDYDALVTRFGTLFGVVLAADARSATLLAQASDPNRRLNALRLADDRRVALIPSSKYLKDFSMTYKESLEAGADVKAIYDCRDDGTGILQIDQLAWGMLADDTRLDGIVRGVLSGYIR